MYVFDERGFNEFRVKHPELRYFQALRHFMGVDRIEVVYHEEEDIVREDTFYYQNENSVKRFLITFLTKDGRLFEQVMEAETVCQAVMQRHADFGVEHDWATKNVYPIVYSSEEI
jgi:hypothetical protein